MIETLKIQNFQSHKNSVLEFSPGVNIITGTSDSGKTAVLRALKWLVWNKPGGDAFRSAWGGDTKVEVSVDNKTIVRSKGKENLYKLEDIVFKAFGTSVPSEIQEQLNLSEINFQQQLDSPFLLTKSPGEVAKHFNKVAHLDQIDSSLSAIQSEIRSLESSRKYEQEYLAELKEKKNTFAYLANAEKDIEEVRTIKDDYISSMSDFRNLSILINKINDLDDEILDANEITLYEKYIDIILNDFESKRSLRTQLENLNSLIDDIYLIDENIEKEEALLSVEKNINDLLDLFTEKDVLRNNTQALETAIFDIQQITKRINTGKEYVLKAEEKFKKNFPDICPLCGSKIKK